MRAAILAGLLLAAPAIGVEFEGARDAGAAQLAHGDRLLDVLDCRGCHGAKLTGYRFVNKPATSGIIWSSNLTLAVPQMSDAQLRAALVDGVHPVRGELWVMPSMIYRRLADADLAAIIAALRAQKPAGDPRPAPVLGPAPEAEPGLAIRPSASLITEWAQRTPADAGKRHQQGRYIASVACAVCHGPDLTGVEGFTPDMAVAAAYSRREFETLLTKGVGVGGRKINWLMETTAKENAARLTVKERDALYGYLIARANLPDN